MAQPETRNRASMIISVILIGLGVLILLGQVLHIGALWPLFIIVPGLMFFVGMAFGGKAAGPLAIPGSIVTMVGLILLVQSWLDHYASWVYAWALIPVAVGVGMVIHGMWSGDEQAAHNGRRVMAIGMVIFLVMGSAFELIFNLSKLEMAGYVWPIVMIGVGVFLLVRRGGERPARVQEIPARPVESAPPRPPAPPTPRTPPAPAEPQFEPLDMTRGKRSRSRAKASERDK